MPVNWDDDVSIGDGASIPYATGEYSVILGAGVSYPFNTAAFANGIITLSGEYITTLSGDFLITVQ